MKKKAVSLLLILALALGLAVPAMAYTTPDFSDVPSNHWAYESVMEMADAGAIKGVGGGCFDPEGKLSAEMFIVLIGRIIYPDVQTTGDDWSGPYVEKAKSTGLLEYTTVTDATLKDEITRYDVSEILHAAAVNFTDVASFTKGATPENQKEIYGIEDERELADVICVDWLVKDNIADYDSIPPKYRNAVEGIYSAGLMIGDERGNFNGGNTLTRMEATVILQRFLKIKEASALARRLKIERVAREIKELTSKKLADLSRSELADVLYEMDDGTNNLLRKRDPSLPKSTEFSQEEWDELLGMLEISDEAFVHGLNDARTRQNNVTAVWRKMEGISPETIGSMSDEELGNIFDDYFMSLLEQRDLVLLMQEHGITAKFLEDLYRRIDEENDRMEQAGWSSVIRCGERESMAEGVAVIAARMAQAEGAKEFRFRAHGDFIRTAIYIHDFTAFNFKLGLFGEDGKLIGTPIIDTRGKWELEVTLPTDRLDEKFSLRLLEPVEVIYETGHGFCYTPEESKIENLTMGDLVRGRSVPLGGDWF